MNVSLKEINELDTLAWTTDTYGHLLLQIDSKYCDIILSQI